MARRPMTRLAAGAVVTGIATLAIAAPASAASPKDPVGGSTAPTVPISNSDSWEWYEVALGALGGIALAGGAVAVAESARRRNENIAHPA